MYLCTWGLVMQHYSIKRVFLLYLQHSVSTIYPDQDKQSAITEEEICT